MSQNSEIKSHKDGEVRDKRGRWAGKSVIIRKPYYDLIETWRKNCGMGKAEFWRQAVMRGALEIARGYGLNAVYPELTDDLPLKPAQKVNNADNRPFSFWNKA